MTDQQKIYDWCDRYQALSGVTHGLLVYKSSALHAKTNEQRPYWIAVAQELRQHWINIELTTGSTSEDAIAKLAKALGL